MVTGGGSEKYRPILGSRSMTSTAIFQHPESRGSGSDPFGAHTRHHSPEFLGVNGHRTLTIVTASGHRSAINEVRGRTAWTVLQVGETPS